MVGILFIEKKRIISKCMYFFIVVVIIRIGLFDSNN